jgi:hypothetical protein
MKLKYVLGLLLNEDVKWISFHGAFDFAYFLKLMLGTESMP